MAETQTERRTNNKELNDKIEVLIGMLTVHTHTQETNFNELKAKVDNYFKELDAHTHIYHHEYIGSEIEHNIKASAFWDKVKEGVVEKFIIFIGGAVMSYVGAVLWGDFAVKAQQKAAQQPPAIQQQNQYQPPAIEVPKAKRPTGKDINVPEMP